MPNPIPYYQPTQIFALRLSRDHKGRYKLTTLGYQIFVKIASVQVLICCAQAFAKPLHQRRPGVFPEQFVGRLPGFIK